MSSAHDWYHGRFHDLSVSDCLELLRTKSVGRVAFCDEDGPVVLPVNYTVHDGDIVIRTAPHNTIAHHLNGGSAAFQVDEIDDFTQSGWSVLVRGFGEYVDSVAELPHEARPEPWASGTRSLFIRVRGRTVSGRRLYPS